MFSISARLEANLEPNDLLARCRVSNLRFEPWHFRPLGENGGPLWGRRLLRLEKGGRLQRFIDQKVIDGCIEGGYIPASPNRVLEFSAQLSTEIGSGLVIWNTPYARYQYYGEVYGPNIPDIDPETGVIMGWWSPPGRPKHPTGRKLQYDTAQNTKAGSFWFERAKADHLTEWLDEIRGIARAQR